MYRRHLILQSFAAIHRDSRDLLMRGVDAQVKSKGMSSWRSGNIIRPLLMLVKGPRGAGAKTASAPYPPPQQGSRQIVADCPHCGRSAAILSADRQPSLS